MNVTLTWQIGAREAEARFNSEAEARACAAIVRTRPDVHTVQLYDAEGCPLLLQEGDVSWATLLWAFSSEVS